MSFDGVIFHYDLRCAEDACRCGRVLHILCTQGSMSFIHGDIQYNVMAGDYVILPSGVRWERFAISEDYTSEMFSISPVFVYLQPIRNNYGVIGQLSLMRNPVMHLSQKDYQDCLSAIETLHRRMADTDHLYFEQMIGTLLTSHILDLYNIHSRQRNFSQLSERSIEIMRQFVTMLFEGEYRRHRDLSFYADRICITPHYLSDVCKKVSGQPANYWIDHFTVQDITIMLNDESLTLGEIIERLNFSSLSYFSRYVKKHLGLSPSQLR